MQNLPSPASFPATSKQAQTDIVTRLGSGEYSAHFSDDSFVIEGEFENLFSKQPSAKKEQPEGIFIEDKSHAPFGAYSYVDPNDEFESPGFNSEALPKKDAGTMNEIKDKLNAYVEEKKKKLDGQNKVPVNLLSYAIKVILDRFKRDETALNKKEADKIIKNLGDRNANPVSERVYFESLQQDAVNKARELRDYINNEALGDKSPEGAYERLRKAQQAMDQFNDISHKLTKAGVPSDIKAAHAKTCSKVFGKKPDSIASRFSELQKNLSKKGFAKDLSSRLGKSLNVGKQLADSLAKIFESLTRRFSRKPS